MKSRSTNIRDLVSCMRPVNLGAIAVNHFVSDGAATIFVNATAAAELAQIWADPRGRNESAKLCRQVIRLTGDIKLSLTRLMRARATEDQKQKMLTRLCTDYEALRKAMTKLGEKNMPGLGIAIPQLL